MSLVYLLLSVVEDSLHLHMVLLELEAVEKQIRGLLDKRARLHKRRTALETACTTTYKSKVPGILKKDVSIGAVVLHVGANNIRLRQTEVLKRDFASLIETQIVEAPLAAPTLKTTGVMNTICCLLITGICSGSILGCFVLMAGTPAASERNCCQTASPRHYTPSDCLPNFSIGLISIFFGLSFTYCLEVTACI